MYKHKIWKWRLLRHLPGKTGRYYERRFQFHHAREMEIRKAVQDSPGKTCIDLGANVGYYTRIMAETAGTVIAFEPDPYALDILRNNLANLDNVKIENAAADVREGTVLLYRHARFYEDPTRYSVSSSIIAGKNNISTANAVNVRQIDFIRYLEDLDEDIGILKVDIEGAEVDLLEALFDRPEILRRIDYIFAETHEHAIADHRPRVEALRERASQMTQPYVNLQWN